MWFEVHSKSVIINRSHHCLKSLSGMRCQKILQAFDCDTLCFGRPGTGIDIDSPEALDDAFKTVDIVITCLPSTPETRGMINSQRIASMKPDAILVNAARGSLVNEPALIHALQNKSIGGAVIDVTKDEPIEAGHPWWNCPNTILTQHSAGGYDEELVDKTRFFIENFKRFEEDGEVLNVVDLKKGY